MSSQSKTPNLQLNQWAATDPVVRTDFNADNAKIDAAVGANPWVKLKEITTAAAAAQVDVDMSDVNISGYMDVIVCVKLKCATYMIRVNGLAASGDYLTDAGNNLNYVYYYSGGTSDGSLPAYIHVNRYYSNVAVWANGFSKNSYPSANTRSAGLTSADTPVFSTLNIVASSGTIGAGSLIRIYALK